MNKQTTEYFSKNPHLLNALVTAALEQFGKLDDPEVIEAISLLKQKGITFNQIEEVYSYYEEVAK